MRPEYDGVKFYSKEDFGSAWALQKAEPTLASFNADGDYNDINKVLRRWTKGYTIKQPNMDCQPTEITALMRHRAVFS